MARQNENRSKAEETVQVRTRVSRSSYGDQELAATLFAECVKTVRLISNRPLFSDARKHLVQYMSAICEVMTTEDKEEA